MSLEVNTPHAAAQIAYTLSMTGRQIQALRHAVAQTPTQFGARFGVSGRTVEGWEGKSRRPNRWVLAELLKLEKKVGDRQKAA